MTSEKGLLQNGYSIVLRQSLIYTGNELRAKTHVLRGVADESYFILQHPVFRLLFSPKEPPALPVETKRLQLIA